MADFPHIKFSLILERPASPALRPHEYDRKEDVIRVVVMEQWKNADDTLDCAQVRDIMEHKNLACAKRLLVKMHGDLDGQLPALWKAALKDLRRRDKER